MKPPARDPNQPLTATIGFSSHRLRLDGDRARSLYRWLVARMERLGVPPDIVTLDAPGFWGVKYKRFRRVRTRIESYDFGGRFRGLRLTLRAPGWTDNDQSKWISTASFHRNSELPHKDSSKQTDWLIAPKEAKLTEQVAVESLTEYAKVAVDHYGYLFTIPREYGPSFYPMGRSGWEPFASQEERENAGWWAGYQDLVPPTGMLRNVYPVNFVSRELLELPVHGTTLEQWIRKNTSRGTLKPLTVKVTTWITPVENIPAIREQLFLAGVLFYFRFFQTWEPNNPWNRDFSKRFKPLDPIPEIFRANYRQLTDSPVEQTTTGSRM